MVCVVFRIESQIVWCVKFQNDTNDNLKFLWITIALCVLIDKNLPSGGQTEHKFVVFVFIPKNLIIDKSILKKGAVLGYEEDEKKNCIYICIL